MPNVFFLMTRKASEEMSDEVFNLLGRAIAVAVSQVLQLDGPDQVGIYEVIAKRSMNVNPIQVICLASASPARLEKLTELKDAVAAAILSLGTDERCAALFKKFGKSESWPIMPSGSWREVLLT